MNVPNLITLARLVSAPVVVWLILEGWIMAAFWVFLAAAVSDAADGIIAKRFDAETVFGGFIDPIADKVLLVSVYVSLGYRGFMEDWLVIMVVFRDALIVGGALLFQTITQSLSMQPLMISKVNTFVQLVFAAIVLGSRGYGIDDLGLLAVLTYIVAATTILSGGVYVITWSQRAAALEEGPAAGPGGKPEDRN
ncbi:MAG TPA: CDP-alcohol phosphatidyltransferase family protein [Rhodospirillales bacterium]|jgi:cardiolipin synthase